MFQVLLIYIKQLFISGKNVVYRSEFGFLFFKKRDNKALKIRSVGKRNLLKLKKEIDPRFRKIIHIFKIRKQKQTNKGSFVI